MKETASLLEVFGERGLNQAIWRGSAVNTTVCEQDVWNQVAFVVGRGRHGII